MPTWLTGLLVTARMARSAIVRPRNNHTSPVEAVVTASARVRARWAVVTAGSVRNRCASPGRSSVWPASPGWRPRVSSSPAGAGPHGRTRPTSSGPACTSAWPRCRPTAIRPTRTLDQPVGPRPAQIGHVAGELHGVVDPVALDDDLDRLAVPRLEQHGCRAVGPWLGRQDRQAVDPGLAQVLPGVQVGRLHQRGQVAAAPVAAEVDRAGPVPGEQRRGLVGLDPAVVDAVGQHHDVGGEPVAAHVRRLPHVGHARGGERPHDGAALVGTARVVPAVGAHQRQPRRDRARRFPGGRGRRASRARRRAGPPGGPPARRAARSSAARRRCGRGTPAGRRRAACRRGGGPAAPAPGDCGRGRRGARPPRRGGGSSTRASSAPCARLLHHHPPLDPRCGADQRLVAGLGLGGAPERAGTP